MRTNASSLRSSLCLAAVCALLLTALLPAIATGNSGGEQLVAYVSVDELAPLPAPTLEVDKYAVQSVAADFGDERLVNAVSWRGPVDALANLARVDAGDVTNLSARS